jgi:hypothetical protein
MFVLKHKWLFSLCAQVWSIVFWNPSHSKLASKVELQNRKVEYEINGTLLIVLPISYNKY